MENKGNKTKSNQGYYSSDEEIERDKKYGMNSSKDRDKSLCNPKLACNPLSRNYYCELCHVNTTGFSSWRQHKLGKRHASNSKIERKRRDDKRKCLERQTNQETYKNVNKKRKLDEETNENNGLVGLDYVLVIHREGKSVFQCLLCDTCTMYENPKQLTDHILEDKHQKAYAEQNDKGLIKIKRLKSKKPGKGALEESIIQKLLNPDRKDTLETSSLRKSDNLSNCDKKSTKRTCASTSSVKKNQAHIFLRNTLKQVENHNRRYPLGKRPSTFVPERRSSSSTPEIVSVKDLTPANQTSSSCIRPQHQKINSKKTSPKNPVFQESIIILSDGEDVPAVSSKSAKPSVSELEKTLTTVDVFNLVLLKLKSIEFSKEELDLLTEVAEKSTKASKEFNNKNLIVQGIIPFISDIMEEKSTTYEVTVEKIPFINDIMEENCTTHEGTHAFTVEPLPATENSSSTADMGPNPSIILPDSVWINLPSVQDLDNIQSCNPLYEQDLGNILRDISDSLKEKTIKDHS